MVVRISLSAEECLEFVAALSVKESTVQSGVGCREIRASVVPEDCRRARERWPGVTARGWRPRRRR
jgi:hypothetical protein